MRSATWYKAGSTPDVLDEIWRHHAKRENHFSPASFTLFQPLLKACVEEQWDVLSRPVRGKRYIESLINSSNSLFRFYQGNSVAAQRTAVGHATSAVMTNNKEVLSALGDLDFPKYVVAGLGSSDEPLVVASMKFFEQVEVSLHVHGEPHTTSYRKKIDAELLSKFLAHHSSRGVQLISRCLRNPDFNVDTRYAAGRILLEIAGAEGKNSRAAMRTLQEFCSPMNRVETGTAALQPQVRQLIADALMSPTPALVHAAYALPSIFRLVDLSNDIPTQSV